MVDTTATHGSNIVEQAVSNQGWHDWWNYAYFARQPLHLYTPENQVV